MDTPLRRVVVSDYDERWPAIAVRLMARIEAACGPHLVRVEHIGSTAVPGLAAKPVIDLAPVATGEAGRDACVPPMVGLGYEHRGEYGVPGRQYFRSTDEVSGLDVHVHLFAATSVYLRRHLLLRDYLRARPAEAAAYGQFKRGLATRPWASTNDYAEAKTPFIVACLVRAEAWALREGWQA